MGEDLNNPLVDLRNGDLGGLWGSMQAALRRGWVKTAGDTLWEGMRVVLRERLLRSVRGSLLQAGRGNPRRWPQGGATWEKN